MCEGIADEIRGINLGDRRLNKRSVKVLEALAANPQASINASCETWGDTVAAYRLLDNPAVTPEEILAPHRQATQRRMKAHPVVLLVQDTTELDLTAHPPQDARCLNEKYRFGLYHHVQLAVTPDGLPLGVVAAENFDRSAESLGKAAERHKLPIEQKESYRWLKGYQQASELAREHPPTGIVSVADCEADIYDIYAHAQQQPAGRADYVIRVKEDRSTVERAPEAGPASYRKVRDEVRLASVVATRNLDLGETPKRSQRSTTLEVRARTVQIKPPQLRSALPSVTANVLLVQEVNGPGDGTDVCWLLITTLPITTSAEVLRVIDYYVARWSVEIYFRMLKTGCRVEDLQLETMARLKNCLAFYNIIAWRILHLTYLNRTSPHLPCTAVFDDAEWKSVWIVEKRQPLPPTPPTLSDFMKLVTQLGGYNNRATEAPAGPQTVWIGVRRMLDFATAWLRFGPESRDSAAPTTSTKPRPRRGKRA